MLRIVKGDVLEFHITLCNIDPVAIVKLVFTSKDLGIEVEAIKDDEEYRVVIPGSTTRNFKSGFARYDILASLWGMNEEVTIEHRKMIEILEREAKDG